MIPASRATRPAKAHARPNGQLTISIVTASTVAAGIVSMPTPPFFRDSPRLCRGPPEKNARGLRGRDLAPVGHLPAAAGELEDAVVVLHGEVGVAVDRQLVQRDRPGLAHLAAVDG